LVALSLAASCAGSWCGLLHRLSAGKHSVHSNNNKPVKIWVLVY